MYIVYAYISMFKLIVGTKHPPQLTTKVPTNPVSLV